MGSYAATMTSSAPRSRAISAAFSTAQYEAGVPFVPTTIWPRPGRGFVSVCRHVLRMFASLPTRVLSLGYLTYCRYIPTVCTEPKVCKQGCAGLFGHIEGGLRTAFRQVGAHR